MPQFLSRDYWIEMAKMNWLTWLALAAIAAVLWYHISGNFRSYFAGPDLPGTGEKK